MLTEDSRPGRREVAATRNSGWEYLLPGSSLVRSDISALELSHTEKAAAYDRLPRLTTGLVERSESWRLSWKPRWKF
jgi:hypothetical protein